MKVTTISFKRLANIGNFEHQSIEVMVELEEGETPGAALNRAKAFVELGLKKRPSPNDWATSKEVLANPDAYTGWQVKEAERIRDLVETTPEEIPF